MSRSKAIEGSATDLIQRFYRAPEFERRLLAGMMATYLAMHEAEDVDEFIDVVFVMPDGKGQVSMAGLVVEPERAQDLLLHGLCGISKTGLQQSLKRVQERLGLVWGERATQGMQRVGRDASSRPSGKRPNRNRNRRTR